MVSRTRTQRIGDRIREELSEMLLMEVSDPRLDGISITDVEVDRELAYANVYVSALEGEQRWQEILAGLEHAQGYLRHELSQRIDLRTFPRLRFRWDPTLERAEKIERLIASLHEETSVQEPVTLANSSTTEGVIGEEASDND
jgi:ribosome-binding factor A